MIYKIKKIILLAMILQLFFLYREAIAKKEKILSSSIKFSNLSGGETLCPGAVFEIQWEGVNSSEPVNIEYSTNGGLNWITIADAATGLKYNWTVPNTASTNCVARVKAEVVQNNCVENWATTNLDVDHYRNGDSIPEVRDETAWANLTTGAWCYHNNDPSNGTIYGKLYNWYAVNDSRGLAPTGWHVPSDDEWKTLEMCLGMSQSEADATDWRGSDEGGKLKETGTSHWLSPNTGATNESGFSALPGGWRLNNGSFYNMGYYGDWWSATEYDATYAWVRRMGSSDPGIYRYYYYKGAGMSVRCVKD